MADELNRFVTNTVSASGGQSYGIDQSGTNAALYETFGSQNIVVIDHTGEGVVSGVFTAGHPHAGETGYLTTRSIVNTLDLISEGEIEGIVSGEWIPSGTTDAEGQIGWETGSFQSFNDQNPESFLRSIYLNDTPVVNQNGLYNFQSCEVSIANGTPSGIRDGDNFLNASENLALQKSRVINERLRGPDINDDDDNPFYYYSKVYRFVNNDLDKIKIHIKIPALSYTKVENSHTPIAGETTNQLFGGLGLPFALSNSDPILAVTKAIWPTEELGQTVGSELTFKIRYRPLYKDKLGNISASVSKNWYGLNGAAGSAITSKVEGLIRSPYLHEITIPLKADLSADNTDRGEVAGWEVEITRVTIESIESNVLNQSFVDTITEIFESELTYPNSAMVSMNFNAEYFSQVPTRSYDMKLLKVKVPKGYHPDSRQYNHDSSLAGGVWDGTFQTEKQWTDNPAWIFYDLLTNKRYGIGKHLGDEVNIDKWTLYEISKFCDTLVSNGEGGLEPRFTCNVYINTREDAFKVIRDFASAFRAMAYYGFGTVNTVMDKPREEVGQFTNVNVREGNFTYSSSSKSSIPTVCLVRYNDKDNFYKPAIEYVENTEGIRKFGVKEKEVTAFACTSRSQARRLGRWILSTDMQQTETISFQAGPEAMLLKPGDIVSVTDTNRATGKYAGRTTQVSGSGIVLDRVVDIKDNTNYFLSLTTPTHYYDESIVSGLDQSDYADFRRAHIQTFDFNKGTSSANSSPVGITVSNVGISGASEVSGTKITHASEMFSDSVYDLASGTVWSIAEIDQKNRNLYSVTSIKENTNDLTFSVEGVLHDTGKYSYIESGIFYSYVASPQGFVATPLGPPHPTVSQQYIDGSSGQSYTKVIKVTVNENASVGTSSDTTIGYKIYIKAQGDSSGWVDADFTEVGGSVPKSKYLVDTLYTSDPGALEVRYMPFKNESYYIRVFSINSVGSLSSSYGEATITITGHEPIKDVRIHSLKLRSDYAWQEAAEAAPSKAYDLNTSAKDAQLQWSVSFLNQDVANTQQVLDNILSYRVSIHEPNGTSIHPGALKTGYFTNENTFDFTFDRNRLIPDGPLRNYDVVVTAFDENGNFSSGVARDSSHQGWDILQVSNPKPTGYYLTPRESAGLKDATQLAQDKMWTDQWIDGDGYVHVQLLSNTFTDLAGGFAYVSKHPFSGADFDALGNPKDISERIYDASTNPNGIVFNANEQFKTGEYQIIETNFEAAGTGVYNAYDSEIIFRPTLTGAFNPPYYMAIKFYDSFDREIKNKILGGASDADGKITGSWRSGLITGSSDIYKNSGLQLAFGRDTTGTAGTAPDYILSTDYCFTNTTCGGYLGAPDEGTKVTTSNTFSVEINPTKYYSANQGGFKYWIRMNVNGQWEGQGISHVKVLTAKDVDDQYDYHGYFEYACYHDELGRVVGGGTEFYPNKEVLDGTATMVNSAGQNFIGSVEIDRAGSHSFCRFRQGQVGSNGIVNIDNKNLRQGGALQSYTTYTAGGSFTYKYKASYLTTGATRIFNSLPASIKNGSSPLPSHLSKAGVAYTWGQAFPNTDIDKISSYNERGQIITQKSRPLRGFRRFRIYFDENNLPAPSNPSGLSSYSVVGINSWNGQYESWPANPDGAGIPPSSLSSLEENLAFAKDGYNVFPSSVISWLNKGDLFENIPGVWNHHPAGFGQGFGGLVKTQKFFDVHLGRLIDDSYLNEAFFGVVTTNDYSIRDQLARLPAGYAHDSATNNLHEAVYDLTDYAVNADGVINYNSTDPI